MSGIAVGTVAFVLFFLYDLCSLKGWSARHAWLRSSFAAGCLLLLGGTASLLWPAVDSMMVRPVHTAVWAVFALAFLVALAYTLFFALPFRSTYVTASEPALCRTGIYALCRHPGVLWLGGLYLCLWRLADNRSTLAAWLLFTLLDILYAWFQDRVTFMRAFPDYATYRSETPFLLPTIHSVRRCFATWSRKGDRFHDL